jgi:hypothetical protein
VRREKFRGIFRGLGSGYGFDERVVRGVVWLAVGADAF